ncbi:MAG: hypothetical protein M1833_001195 [Piccolia ochrophora]|nr:MAG: hypothetical protein M1833_001195 [Piccolia ochrophora]
MQRDSQPHEGQALGASSVSSQRQTRKQNEHVGLHPPDSALRTMPEDFPALGSQRISGSQRNSAVREVAPTDSNSEAGPSRGQPNLEDRIRSLLLRNDDNVASSPPSSTGVTKSKGGSQPSRIINTSNQNQNTAASLPNDDTQYSPTREFRIVQGSVQETPPTSATRPFPRQLKAGVKSGDHSREPAIVRVPAFATGSTSTSIRQPQPSNNRTVQTANRNILGINQAPGGAGYPQHQSPTFPRPAPGFEGVTRGGNAFQPRGGSQKPQLFNPHAADSRPRNQRQAFPVQGFSWNEATNQTAYLQTIARSEVEKAAIEEWEVLEKEAFRALLEGVCRTAVTDLELSDPTRQEFDSASVELKCFGSLGSGFATKSSDMDLALLTPHSQPQPGLSESPIPRLLEKHFLNHGYGARLLTRTRVPIIKLCQSPSEELMSLLKLERETWEQSCHQQSTQDQTEDLQDNPNENRRDDGIDRTEQLNTDPEALDNEIDPKSLAQQQNESLHSYFRRTKAILTKMGAQDIDLSQIQHVKPDVLSSLEIITRAFVRGLRDEELRQRVNRHNLLSQVAFPRSLTGFWIQVEGERVAMSWESRKIFEATEAKEKHGMIVVKDWLQHQDKASVDGLSFERALRRGWNRLKELSSAMLPLLEQRAGETAESYSARATALLKDLGGIDRSVKASATLTERQLGVLREVNGHFLDGIRDISIKQSLIDFASSRNSPAFAEVASQLQAECQMKEYHAAIEKGVYSLEHQKIIEEYAIALRQHGLWQKHPTVTEALQKLHQLPKPPLTGRRDRYADRLAFPKTGVGIQCDINFSNRLAICNTELLRCYNLCDPRVRPMVLFVKAWAAQRAVNTPYRGTLSSYGYVLMVLHFLVNIAVPPVIPNLQLSSRLPGTMLAAGDWEVSIEGYDVRFWRNEREIQGFAARGLMTQNKESIGSLLRGFFDYYSYQGPHVTAHGFSWGLDVLSLRTNGGLVSKKSKGWTGARTTTADTEAAGQGQKEVKHRYLFAIEDPFEHDHNIARTVTHNGIVAIRDEFRRAWRIITTAGRESSRCDEDLFLAVEGGDSVTLPDGQHA